MKTLVTAAMAATLGLAGFSTATAQTDVVIAEVPFQFVVGDATLPSDVYRVSRVMGANGALLVRGSQRGVTILARRADATQRSETPTLVFHRYADQYFLREIRFLGDMAMALPETRAERDAAERRADGTLKRETVVIGGQRR